MSTALDAYLDQVVPTIGQLRWADTILLQPGVNVMDLTDIPAEMQHLVIKSSLDWVLNTTTDTVVVIPEAWKFIPQGRGTPVKLAAEALIRQGAALRNYVWLDSQDLGGIEKVILRSVAVWLLGVQREANEIKRTLENIPAGVAKPSKADLATLGLGEFYACWGRHAVKTYAQPTWVTDDLARRVAQGELAVDAAARAARIDQAWKEAATVTDEQAKRLIEENALRRSENTDLRRRLERLETLPSAEEVRGILKQPDAPGTDAGFMSLPHLNGDAEAVYQAIKARLLTDAKYDPVLLNVLAKRSDIVVEIEPVTVTVDGSTVKGRVARLIAQGWFRENVRAVGDVRKELARTGSDPGGGGALGILLGNLVKDGLLTREGNGFLIAPGVKATERELRV
jgi:hypothetical protein